MGANTDTERDGYIYIYTHLYRERERHTHTHTHAGTFASALHFQAACLHNPYQVTCSQFCRSLPPLWLRPLITSPYSLFHLSLMPTPYGYGWAVSPFHSFTNQSFHRSFPPIIWFMSPTHRTKLAGETFEDGGRGLMGF